MFEYWLSCMMTAVVLCGLQIADDYRHYGKSLYPSLWEAVATIVVSILITGNMLVALAPIALIGAIQDWLDWILLRMSV